MSTREEALRKDGWLVEKARGLGKGSVRRITRGGKSKLCSIRITQDQLIAFPRNEMDNGWSKLADVDMVVVASGDDPASPRAARIHLFDANEVRDRFDRTYAARIAAGHSIPVGRGVWLGLYTPDGAHEPPSCVGGGIGNKYPPIAVIPFADLQAPTANGFDDEGGDDALQLVDGHAERPAEQPAVPLTISEQSGVWQKPSAYRPRT
ncbi:hypothetical protein [Cupriavidus agavae]|uniref:Uncharacterized protein n=1 Tax=Cupriavidus agavae TaxID=1001822 RepID=A0A4V2FI23_9BURK|nr:hypothetical protein [Cupriavidus agavae]RZT42279.1 hypothetical protein EV147_1307 [Cupriavidus agavae]